MDTPSSSKSNEPLPPLPSGSKFSGALLLPASNPGSAIHKAWLPVYVHTAKCDGCQKHNESVIQRCHRCNLQYCQACMHKVRETGNHDYDAEELDWDPSNASPTTRDRGSRAKHLRDGTLPDASSSGAPHFSASASASARKPKKTATSKRAAVPKKATGSQKARPVSEAGKHALSSSGSASGYQRVEQGRAASGYQRVEAGSVGTSASTANLIRGFQGVDKGTTGRPPAKPAVSSFQYVDPEQGSRAIAQLLASRIKTGGDADEQEEYGNDYDDKEDEEDQNDQYSQYTTQYRLAEEDRTSKRPRYDWDCDRSCQVRSSDFRTLPDMNASSSQDHTSPASYYGNSTAAANPSASKGKSTMAPSRQQHSGPVSAYSSINLRRVASNIRINSTFDEVIQFVKKNKEDQENIIARRAEFKAYCSDAWHNEPELKALRDEGKTKEATELWRAARATLYLARDLGDDDGNYGDA